MKGERAFDLIRDSSPTVSVGILTADQMNLRSELALLDQTDVKMIHFDVMDGCFCPMMTVGPPYIKGVETKLLKDVHLMIQDPLEKAEDFVRAGADIVAVHVESCEDLRPVLRRLGDMENSNDPRRGIVRGVAINPGTPVNMLEPLVGSLEMISILAVEPGIKGQAFSGSTSERVRQAKELISASGRQVLLCIDGGIKRDNIVEVAKLGADIVVSGSAIFDGKAPLENARLMLNAVKGGPYAE